MSNFINDKAKSAFTFLEIVISLSILSVIFVAGTFILHVALENVKRSNFELIATNLSRGLMGEIMTRRFDENTTLPWTAPNLLGIEPGQLETRFGTGITAYDDVDDYIVFLETIPIGIDAVSMDGNNGTPNYSNFRRMVSVAYVEADMDLSLIATDYKRVSVTVQAQGIPDMVLVEVKAANVD